MKKHLHSNDSWNTVGWTSKRGKQMTKYSHGSQEGRGFPILGGECWNSELLWTITSSYSNQLSIYLFNKHTLNTSCGPLIADKTSTCPEVGKCLRKNAVFYYPYYKKLEKICRGWLIFILLISVYCKPSAILNAFPILVHLIIIMARYVLSIIIPIL